jgi:hypothetical protein
MRLGSCGHAAFVLGLVVLGCAKVTTDYPDIGGSSGGGGGYAGSSPSAGSGNYSATGGYAYGGSANAGTATSGGAAPSGGRLSVGGSPVGTGGTTSSGGVPSTGGTATGGLAPVGGWTSVCAAPGSAFCDDFEAESVGGPAAKWTAGSGTWSVATDPTQVAGDLKVYTNSADNAHSVAGTATYTNASIEASIKVLSFSSNSASNAAGIFLRNDGTNEYDLSLGGDGKVYLRRTPTSSTEISCNSGTSNGAGVTVSSSGCSTSRVCTGWFKLKLSVSGTAAAGITITGYVDPTASSGYTQVLQCTVTSGSYLIDAGAAGVFSKGSAPAEYDDVIITTQ